MQAVSSKAGRSWSASSSSGDGMDQKLVYKAHWAKETELRELPEEVRRLKKTCSKLFSLQFHMKVSSLTIIERVASFGDGCVQRRIVVRICGLDDAGIHGGPGAETGASGKGDHHR